MTLYVDTNILVDFLATRGKFYAPAAAIFTIAERGDIRVVLSSVSLVTSQYICCERSRMPLYVWKNKAMRLSEIVGIYPTGESDILFACRSRWKDFEDAVQYSCAARAGSDIIVTRNPRDFALSEIPVLSPQEALRRLYPH